MRPLLLLNLLLLVYVSTYSQEGNHQLDISVFPYYNFVVLQTCAGGGGIDNAPGFRYGIQYSYKYGKSTWINTGFLISQSNHIFTSAVADPMEPIEKIDQTAFIMQIPLRFRIDFNPHFYIKPGVSIDMQFENIKAWNGSLQSGIGFSMLAGYDINLQKNWHLSIEPEMSYFSMIQLPLGQRDNCHEHFLYLGLNVCFGFRFK